MVNLLISAILTGCAVTYVLEMLDVVSLGILEKGTINKVFSLPLSFGGMYALTREINLSLLVTVPAVTLVSLALSKYLNKPIVTQTRLPRL